MAREKESTAEAEATKQEPPKKPRGRPTVGAGTGGFKNVLVSMYQEHIDIAAKIHPQKSVAIRLALEAWDKNYTGESN